MKKEVDSSYTRKEGWIMMKRTIHGRRILGNASFVLVLLFILVVSAVPWNLLYSLDWYQEFLKVMSIFSLNLKKIPETSIKFPEYAISFRGFINAIGPIYAMYGLYLGPKHFTELKNVFLCKPTSNFRLIIYILLGSMFMIGLLWGVYVFVPEKPSILRNYLYGSEWRYVAYHTLLWMMMAAGFFSLSCVILMLFHRVKNR